MSEGRRGFHVVLSYGDVFQQSGYRTKVLGELAHYEKSGALCPFFIVFDRNAERMSDLDLGGVPFRAHTRSAVFQYHRDLVQLSRRGPIRVVHAHNPYSGALALSARPAFRYKILLELHGRIPEEYVILGKGGQVSYRTLKYLESWVVRHSDHIIPVSHKLKEYLVSEYGLPSSKLTVIPDCTDPSVFCWNPELRASTRRQLHLQDKFVCVHLGSFFIWYDPGLILKVFRQIRGRIPSAHLLAITDDVSRCQDYLLKEISAETFTVASVPHREVPRLLTASDVGFLLLRSTPNVKVSSPAKFSEYLNSGLPVLITPEVGDFSSLVAHAEVGATVTDNGEFDLKILDEIARAREQIAIRSLQAGRQLTWNAFRNAWTGVVEALSDKI